MADLEDRVVTGVGEPTAKLAVVQGTKAVVEDPAVPTWSGVSRGELRIGVKAGDRPAAFLRARIDANAHQMAAGPSREVQEYPGVFVPLSAATISVRHDVSPFGDNSVMAPPRYLV